MLHLENGACLYGVTTLKRWKMFRRLRVNDASECKTISNGDKAFTCIFYWKQQLIYLVFKFPQKTWQTIYFRWAISKHRMKLFCVAVCMAFTWRKNDAFGICVKFHFINSYIHFSLYTSFWPWIEHAIRPFYLSKQSILIDADAFCANVSTLVKYKTI